MGENQVRVKVPLQGLEIILDVATDEREKAVTVVLNHHFLLTSPFQKGVCALPRLSRPLVSRAEDNPADAHVFVALQQKQDCPTAANLNVIAVCPQAEQAVR